LPSAKAISTLTAKSTLINDDSVAEGMRCNLLTNGDDLASSFVTRNDA
jgi:hypothetical protein